MKSFARTLRISSLAVLLWSSSSVAANSQNLSGDGAGLIDLYELMLEFDPELKLAESRERRAENSVEIYESQLRPQISFNSQLNRTQYENDLVDYNYNGEKNSISLNQVLFDRKIISSIDQAEFESEFYSAQVQVSQQERLALFVERYLDIVKTQHDIYTLKEELELLEGIQAQVNSLFQKKLVSVVDKANIESRVARASSNLAASEAKLEIAEESLFESVGEAAFEPIALIDLLDFDPELETKGFEYWRDLALATSPVLKAQQLRIKRAEAALAQAESEHYPRVGLQLTHQNTNIGSEFAQSNSNSATVLSLNLSVPIYLGGSTAAKTRVQESELSIAIEEERYSRMQLLREIRVALLEIKSAQSEITASISSEKTANTARLAAEKSFQFGVVDTGTVLERIAEQYSAERNRINLAYKLMLSYLKLMKGVAGIDRDLIVEFSQM